MGFEKRRESEGLRLIVLASIERVSEMEFEDYCVGSPECEFHDLNYMCLHLAFFLFGVTNLS